MTAIRRRRQHGQGMLEYALALGLIALVVIAGVTVIGRQAGKALCQVSTGFNGVSSGTNATATLVACLSVGSGYTMVLGSDGNLWTPSQSGAIARVSTRGVVSEFVTSAGSNPTAVANGPGDGNIWFSEYLAGKIGRLPASATNASQITEYALPGGPTSKPSGMAAGSDGNMYVLSRLAGADSLQRFTIASSSWSTACLLAPGAYPRDLIAAGTKLYFTEQNSGKVGWYDLASSPSTCTEIVTPYTSSTARSSYPYYLALGPDGNIWFTESYPNVNRVASMPQGATATAQITEYPAPTGCTNPWGMASRADALWFTCSGNAGGPAGIASITTTGTTAFFPLPPGTSPLGIVTGSDGNLYFTEQTSTVGPIERVN